MRFSASTPSEDLSSGDAMGINKTGTLGPADKDRRSKKKSVNYFYVLLMLFLKLLPRPQQFLLLSDTSFLKKLVAKDCHLHLGTAPLLCLGWR